MLPPISDLHYAPSAEVNVAFEVIGSGHGDIVFSLGLVGNVELSREVPFVSRWLERLARLGRVIHYDRRGTGLSDRDLSMGLPEQRMDDIRAVMDAAGCARATLVTSVDGGPIAIMFAATYPERVAGLVLYETWARVKPAPDYQVGIDPAGPDSLQAAIHAAWGSGRVLEGAVGDRPGPEARAVLARLERNTASPRVAAEHAALAGESDVRSALATVQVPSLVVWRAGITRYLGLCRWLGDHLPGAEPVELPGSELHSWRPAYEDEVLDHVEGFITGERPVVDIDEDRTLATVLFTDIVGSTERAAAVGDRAWAKLARRPPCGGAPAAPSLPRTGGRHRGRRVLRDVRRSRSRRPVRRCDQGCGAELGVDIRAGLHTGEVEVTPSGVRGIAVHIGARVGAAAGPGEVLVSRTVTDLVSGSGITFDDRGEHELKGVAGRWQLFAVTEVDLESGAVPHDRRDDAHAAGIEVVDSLQDLLTRVHEERPVVSDGLSDRQATEEEHLEVLAVLGLRRGGAHRDASPGPKTASWCSSSGRRSCPA